MHDFIEILSTALSLRILATESPLGFKNCCKTLKFYKYNLRQMLCTGNSMSNHPVFLDVDTLSSQILFIFSLFVDNIEMINP